MISKLKILSVSLIIATVIVAMTPFMKRGELLQDVIFSSIAWVESRGDTNARSRDGSVGILQIKPVMVREVNRICKRNGIDKKFTLSDRLDPDKSRDMFFIFQEYYHPNLDWDTATMSELESVARKWNGGPKGHIKRATKRYWKRVADRLAITVQNTDGISMLDI